MNARFSSVYVAATLMGLVASAHAQTTIQLGTATGYAVLAGSTITNTGASLVTGDIGLSPGTAITGFPPGIIAGATRIAAAAAPAQTDSLAAYNDAFGRPVGTTVTTELGGQTLVAGVYSTASGTLGLTGTLTLDGQNNPNAVFIFKAASTLITASGAPGTPASLVVLRGGAQACNVFWQIGSSTTLGSYSAFQGSVLAAASITANTGASVNGRLLARTGAVTLDTNAVTTPVCNGSIQIVKNTVGGDGTFAFTGNTGVTSLTTVGGTGSQTINLAPGSGYNATETVPAGWTQTGASCTNGTPAAIQVVSGGTTVCTFTNTIIPALPPGSIRVVKNTSGGNGTFAFTSNFGLTTLTTVAGAATQTFTNLVIGSNYSVSEAASAGWTQTSATCTNGTPAAVVVTAGGTTVCTFINTAILVPPPPASGSLTIVKSSIGGNGTFAFNSNFGFSTLTTAGGTATQVFTNLAPGVNYFVSETASAGWTQTSIACTNGTPAAVIVISGGATVCTFINTAIVVPPPPPATGVVTIVKSSIGGNGTFTFTSNFGFTTLTTASGTATQTFTNLTPGSNYSATETATAGWTQTSATCTNGSPSAIIVTGGGVTVCTFINTVVPAVPPGVPDLIITKTHAGNFRQGDIGDTYTLHITNIGAVATTGIVSVTDNLPAGLLATAIAGLGWNCVSGSLVCTRSDALAPGASYPDITVTVNVSGSGADFKATGATLFQADDLFVSMADGTVQWRRNDFSLVKVLPSTTDGQAKGAAFNGAGSLFVTHWFGASRSGNEVAQFTPTGVLRLPLNGVDSAPAILDYVARLFG